MDFSVPQPEAQKFNGFVIGVWTFVIVIRFGIIDIFIVIRFGLIDIKISFLPTNIVTLDKFNFPRRQTITRDFKRPVISDKNPREKTN